VDYLEFRRYLETQLSALDLPTDCTLYEPEWMVLRVPLSWTVSMTFEFGDNNHIAVWENHDKFAGLQESRRIAWSYHYGPVTARDSKGRAIQGAAESEQGTH